MFSAKISEKVFRRKIIVSFEMSKPGQCNNSAIIYLNIKVEFVNEMKPRIVYRQGEKQFKW